MILYLPYNKSVFVYQSYIMFKRVWISVDTQQTWQQGNIISSSFHHLNKNQHINEFKIRCLLPLSAFSHILALYVFPLNSGLLSFKSYKLHSMDFRNPIILILFGTFIFLMISIYYTVYLKYEVWQIYLDSNR